MTLSLPTNLPTDLPAGAPTTPAAGTDGAALPPVAPQVLAAAVADLPSRLRDRLDPTIARLAALPVRATDDGLTFDCGPDTVVTLTPAASGVIAEADQAQCSCLLAPRCLHRAAALGACPVADPAVVPLDTSDDDEEEVRDAGPVDEAPTGTPERTGPTAAQRTAARELWRAASAILTAGIPAAGAVPQAELLRAAHSARLAGLPRAESAALRVVRGLRSARARYPSHRLADLVSVLHDLLLTAGRLAAGDRDPALVGVTRRNYRGGGSLEVFGVCREPVISATGYAGVVTHLVAADGSQYSVSDVRPGGPERARSSATAVVELGRAAVTHLQLSRGGLRIAGATISPDHRLGAGRGVRADPVTGLSWSSGPPAGLFSQPLVDAVRAQLAAGDGEPADPADSRDDLVGGDLVIVGAKGDHVLARELATPDGPLIRLVPANSHSDLAHVSNLRQLAARPGVRIRVVGRLEPDRAATLRPLAVGPVPDTEVTLQLPDRWLGHADLGYDQLQGAHFPRHDAIPAMPPITDPGPDPVSDSPLWRVRRLVELAVAGGRRAVGESARSAGSGLRAPLRNAGFATAADLTDALTAESDRPTRDTFGRPVDPAPDQYTWAWVATATHLAATERALVQSSWSGPCT